MTRERILDIATRTAAGERVTFDVNAVLLACMAAFNERDEALALLDADGKAKAELADKYSIIHDALAWYEDEPNGQRASAALREVSR